MNAATFVGIVLFLIDTNVCVSMVITNLIMQSIKQYFRFVLIIVSFKQSLMSITIFILFFICEKISALT